MRHWWFRGQVHQEISVRITVIPHHPSSVWKPRHVRAPQSFFVLLKHLYHTIHHNSSRKSKECRSTIQYTTYSRRNCDEKVATTVNQVVICDLWSSNLWPSFSLATRMEKIWRVCVVQTRKTKQGLGYVESDEIREVTPIRQNCNQTQWKWLSIKIDIAVKCGRV